MHGENGIGPQVADVGGSILGALGRVYVDDRTGRPLWVSVRPPASGAAKLAPLQGATTDGDAVVLAVSKTRVHGAPNDAGEDHLSTATQVRLHAYYADHLAPGPRE